MCVYLHVQAVLRTIQKLRDDTVMVQTLRAYSSRLAEALITGTISINTNQYQSDTVTRVSINTVLRHIATTLCDVLDINPLTVAHRQVNLKASSTRDMQRQYHYARDSYDHHINDAGSRGDHHHASSVFFRMRTNSFLALLFRYAAGSGSSTTRREVSVETALASAPAAATLAIVGMLRECVLAFESSSLIGETTVWEHICQETIVFDILRATFDAARTSSRQASGTRRGRGHEGGNLEEVTHGFDALLGFVASIAEYAPQRVVLTNTRNEITARCDANSAATTAVALTTEAFLSDAFSAILSIVFCTDASHTINVAMRNTASRSAMRMKAVIVFATIARRSGFRLPDDVRPYVVSDNEDDRRVHRHTVGSNISHPKKMHELMRCLHAALLTQKAVFVSSALDALRGMCVNIDVAEAVRRSEIPIAVCDILHTLSSKGDETCTIQTSAVGLLHDLCASVGGFFDAMRYAIEPLSNFVCVTLRGRHSHSRVWEETAALFDAMTSGPFPRSLRADELATLFGAQSRVLEQAAFISDVHEVESMIFHVATTIQHLLLLPNGILFDVTVFDSLSRVLVALLEAAYAHPVAPTSSSSSSILFEKFFVKVHEIVIGICRIVQDAPEGYTIDNDNQGDEGAPAPAVMKQLRVFLIGTIEEIVFPAVTNSFTTWTPDVEGFRAAIASIALISTVIHISWGGSESGNDEGKTRACSLSRKMLQSRWTSFILRFIEAARADDEDERGQCASEALSLAWKLLCMLTTSDPEITTPLSFYEDNACTFTVWSSEAALQCVGELHSDNMHHRGEVDAYTRYLVKIGTLEMFYVAIKHGDEKVITKSQLHRALASFVGAHEERLRDAFEFLPILLSLGAWSVSVGSEGVTTRKMKMKANRAMRMMHIPMFDSLLAQCPTRALVRIDPGSIAASVILSPTVMVSQASCRLLSCWIEHRCWRWPVLLRNIRDAVRVGSRGASVHAKRHASPRLRLQFIDILREMVHGSSEALTCMIRLLVDFSSSSSSSSLCGFTQVTTKKLQLVYGALIWRTHCHRGQQRDCSFMPASLTMEHTDQVLEVLSVLHAESTRIVDWDSLPSRDEPRSGDLAALCMVFHMVSLMFSLLDLVKTSTANHDGHSSSMSPQALSGMDNLVVAFLDLCRVVVPSVNRFRCASWWPRIEHNDFGEIVDELDFTLKAFVSSCVLSSTRGQSCPSAPSPRVDGGLMNAMLSKLQKTIMSEIGCYLKSLLRRKRRRVSSRLMTTKEEDQDRSLHALTLLFLVLVMSWNDISSEETAKSTNGECIGSAWKGDIDDEIVIGLSSLNALAFGSKRMVDIELLTIELLTNLLCSLSASFRISEHALWVLMDSTARLISASNNSNSIIRFHTALALSRILDSETCMQSFLSYNPWLLVVLHNLTREPEVHESAPDSSQLLRHGGEPVLGRRGLNVAWDSSASLASALGQLALVGLLNSLCMLGRANSMHSELDSILQSCTVSIIDVLARVASELAGGSPLSTSPGYAVLEKLHELELIRKHAKPDIPGKVETPLAPSFSLSPSLQKLASLSSVHHAPLVVDLKRHCWDDLFLFITDRSILP